MDKTDKPTEQQLRDLYEAAVDFKKARPWEYLYDTDLICVENPQDGQIGYCSVMGRSKIHFALGVFLGTPGLASFNLLMGKAEAMPDYEAMHLQDAIMCSFEDREQLSAEDRREIRELGLTFRGGNAWPQFRRFEPGWYPWYINQEECVFLTDALRQTLFVANQYRQGELDLAFDEGRTLLRYSERSDGQLVWQSREFQLSMPVLEYEPVEFSNDLLVRQLKATKGRNNSIFEAETCYLPAQVQEKKGERPYFPRAFILANRKSGLIVDYSAYQEQEDDAQEVLDRMSRLFLNQGIPRQIRVRSDRMVAILEDFCQKTGVKLRVVPRLERIEAFMEALEERV